MTRKFCNDDIISQNLIKSSVQRAIKQSIINQFPLFKDTIDVVLPKKGNIILAKWWVYYKLSIEVQPRSPYALDDPNMLPTMQVDKGALKFILRGSNVMCPGLTSEGGAMDEVESGVVVKILVDGREHACAVGVTTMSTAEIREKNKDVCIENMHFLNDGIWKFGAAAVNS
ncbi:MCT-1/Tma20 like protein [Babesia gibsoni]|uniref:MCT-1/Tma20 like protein n=1 Tax=Babesia gibsoni TaxID=33632 RepID=A0AAD8LIZ1_BABGI|nr:MCT-1/Tma20 like protein [Babesia gibsoni]